MIHWRLGNKEKARECFDNADADAPPDSYVGKQLAPHRNEAATLLEINR
jgi:hypothetical protein